MTSPQFRHRVQPTPIPLREDRFEALVKAHEAFLSGRPGGRRAALSFIVAQGYRCDGRLLADARLDGGDFSGTSFVGADLSRASLYCANLSNCDFRRARLQRADLRGCTFTGAALTDANLDQADLRAAILWVRDDARGMRWMGGRASPAAAEPEDPKAAQPVTYGVDFSNCSLQGARLRDANLKNANFSGANLNGADLIGAKLEGALFRGAILTGLDLSKLSIPSSALADCVLDPTAEARARLGEIRRELERAQDWVTSAGRPAQLDGLDLRPASDLFRGRLLAGLQAKGATAIGVDFTGTKLQGASFDGADLRAADFTGADLRGASFTGARLSHAVFANAELGELELRPGLRLPTRFDDAELGGTGLAPPAEA